MSHADSPDRKPDVDGPSEKTTNCLNCQTEIKGTYCAACGQRARTKRLTIWGLITESLDHVFDLETPLIRTALNCLYRPGWVARQYLEGRRRAFSNPLKFCLLAIAFNVFVIGGLGFDIMAAVMPATDAETPLPAIAIFINRVTKAALDLSLQYAVISSFALIPIYALSLSAMFNRSGWNFTEFFVLGIYVTGSATILQTLIVPVAVVLGPQLFTSLNLMLLLYYFVAPIQFCGGNKIAGGLRSLVVIVIFFMWQGAMSLLVGLIALLNA